MMRMTHRLAVLGAAGGLILAITPAVAAARTGCVVQRVDERGAVSGTFTEREGAVYGQFRCTGGQWMFAWAPFERDDAITAGEIRVDPAGAVSAGRLAGPALSHDLTLAEMAAIAQAATGSGSAVIGRAIVAVDDGRRRTPAEVEALLAGQDTTGVRVLGIVDRPDPGLSTNDLIGGVGGTPETAVVYLSLWGALKGFFKWVVEKINDAAQWLDRHCEHQLTHEGTEIELVCRF